MKSNSASFVPMFNMRTSGEFVWRLVPETKGKTLEDMSNLWKRKA